MQTSDLIAFAAVLAALLSALYARHARHTARRANDIAVHQNLRPLRLAVYQSMKQFSHFCSTYHTLLHVGAVNGTRDLVAQIDSFKWEIDQHGPLAMPEVADGRGQVSHCGMRLKNYVKLELNHAGRGSCQLSAASSMTS